MRISVLHDCFLTKKHIKTLQRLGQLTIFSDCTEKEAIERLKNVDIAVIHCTLLPITGNILKHANKLKFISLASTGFNSVDLESARSKNILISNLPDYGTEAVAEMTIALMLALYRKIPSLERLVRNHPASMNLLARLKESSYMGKNLRDKILGIIGMGRIGLRVAEIASGFGMKVIAYDIIPKSKSRVKMVSLKTLLQKSDVISIHSPLTKKTDGMIGSKEFNLMKSSAMLVNTARGPIVDTKSLYKALVTGKISGAGIDVLGEKLKSNPFLQLENVILTPHTAWYTEESAENIADMIVHNVEAFIAGKPVNLIS